MRVNMRLSIDPLNQGQSQVISYLHEDDEQANADDDKGCERENGSSAIKVCIPFFATCQPAKHIKISQSRASY